MMSKKILITGRTGSGKTTLAKTLAPLIGAVVFDGDAVRALDPRPAGFHPHDRRLHAARMGGLCAAVTASGNNAIASFVCPTAETREAFGADFTIFCREWGDLRYADTNRMFSDPDTADLTPHFGHPPEYWARIAADMIVPVFNPMYKTALFIGRYHPFHAGHKAIIAEGIKKYGQVCIGCRDTNRDWSFNRVKQGIDANMLEYVGRYVVTPLPNVAAVCYGRDVGYAFEQIPMPPHIEAISGTKLRALAFAADVKRDFNLDHKHKV